MIFILSRLLCSHSLPWNQFLTTWLLLHVSGHWAGSFGRSWGWGCFFPTFPYDSQYGCGVCQMWFLGPREMNQPLEEKALQLSGTPTPSWEQVATSCLLACGGQDCRGGTSSWKPALQGPNDNMHLPSSLTLTRNPMVFKRFAGRGVLSRVADSVNPKWNSVSGRGLFCVFVTWAASWAHWFLVLFLWVFFKKALFRTRRNQKYPGKFCRHALSPWWWVQFRAEAKVSRGWILGEIRPRGFFLQQITYRCSVLSPETAPTHLHPPLRSGPPVIMP